MASSVLVTVRRNGGLWFQGLFVVAALSCAAATVIAVSRSSPTAQIPEGLMILLIANMVILVVLAGLIASRYLSIRQTREDGAGGKLTRRFMLLFGTVALIPAVIVSLFLWLSIARGIDTWLGDTVLTLVDEIATITAESGEQFAAQFEEDAQAVADDVDASAGGFEANPEAFETIFSVLATYREFSAAYIIDRTGYPLAIAENMSAPNHYGRPSAEFFEAADRGQPVAVLRRQAGYTFALIKLENFGGSYLYLARPINQDLFARLDRARAAGTNYRIAQERSNEIRTLFVVSYFQIVALVLLLSVRLAQEIAERISRPISRLAGAALEVSEGRRGVSVPLPDSDDEVRTLSNSFNLMTRQLDERRDDLVSAREEAEQRRRFLETLLVELSSGVIRIDSDGVVTIANRSAETLLNLGQLEGRILVDLSPDISKRVNEFDSRRSEDDTFINMMTEDGIRHVRVKVTSDSVGGFVITLDDTTRLISAQRQMAWRDVARRIAHEIRNPLTPIQLSTERLRRRYGDKIDDHDGVFERCINTILRQVSDIGRMVQEFSDFARMPKPTPVKFDLAALITDVVFAQRVVHPDFDFDLKLPEPGYHIQGDERLLGQALTNLVKNAAEALSRRPQTDESQGHIAVSAEPAAEDGFVVISVEDNGPGFPQEARDQLMEPYVTTREGGTGLGLAIVNRVIMDHGGSVQLLEPPFGSQGAIVKIILPISLTGAADAEPQPLEYANEY
ncbi:MAG: PAS domain-containing sensor histidine kinase [Pseudomonadota bacterium]